MNRARTPLIAGNWKMHHGGASGAELAAAVQRIAAQLRGVECVVAPPFTALAAVAQTVAEIAEQTGHASIGVAAQNFYPEEKGAFTGEVSASMLADAGCNWVIVGHSERRQLFGETDAFVAKKAKVALEARLHPIVCVGETLEERGAGATLEVVLRQLRAATDALVAGKGAAVVAYEPVWAIGTGKNATPADAQEVHAAIRKELSARDAGLAERTRILYGGSVKADNAASLLGQPDVDGALVGGASLDVAAFGAILRAAAELASRPTSA
ncbi:MAG: triose-phosphate isomerase [Deltaproteobacteria bacterium]|nr:triose-phosphate isomerase [Deltaproteobacteria bacterium]